MVLVHQPVARLGCRSILVKQVHDELEGSEFNIYLEAVSIRNIPDTEEWRFEGDLGVVDDISEFVAAARFASIGLPDMVNEEETKAKFITPMIQALGWDFFNSTEVRMEHSIEQSDKRCDYTLFGPESETPTIVIEAKKYGRRLHGDPEAQLSEYARILDAQWGVSANGEEVRIYLNPRDGSPLEEIAQIPIGAVPSSPAIAAIAREAFYNEDPTLSHLDSNICQNMVMAYVPPDAADDVAETSVIDKLVSHCLSIHQAEEAVKALKQSRQIYEPSDGRLVRID